LISIAGLDIDGALALGRTQQNSKFRARSGPAFQPAKVVGPQRARPLVR
jgi:hypothetical protein